MTAQIWNWGRCAGALIVLLAVGAVFAAKPTKPGTQNPSAQTVEMFAAIEKGDIAVKLIPKDSTQCTVRIENKTDKPLNVKLPDAFAGVPVLAQAMGPGVGPARGSGRSNSNNNRNQGNQGMGGGMGGMMGGGMFNVPAEKCRKLVVPTVCLDHGKAEPRPSVPYEIKPVENYTTKPGVRELCELLGNGKVDRRVAQAAAWHLNNDMTWQQLAAKTIHHTGGRTEPFYSPVEFRAGMQAAAVAVRTARERDESRKTNDSNADVSASGKTPVVPKAK
ncbi:MAG: hypothetical protein ABFC96_10220 [Thermoguttaceae bacterium]